MAKGKAKRYASRVRGGGMKGFLPNPQAFVGGGVGGALSNIGNHVAQKFITSNMTPGTMKEAAESLIGGLIGSVVGGFVAPLAPKFLTVRDIQAGAAGYAIGNITEAFNVAGMVGLADPGRRHHLHDQVIRTADGRLVRIGARMNDYVNAAGVIGDGINDYVGPAGIQDMGARRRHHISAGPLTSPLAN